MVLIFLDLIRLLWHIRAYIYLTHYMGSFILFNETEIFAPLGGQSVDTLLFVKEGLWTSYYTNRDVFFDPQILYQVKPHYSAFYNSTTLVPVNWTNFRCQPILGTVIPGHQSYVLQSPISNASFQQWIGGDSFCFLFIELRNSRLSQAIYFIGTHFPIRVPQFK